MWSCPHECHLLSRETILTVSTSAYYVLITLCESAPIIFITPGAGGYHPVSQMSRAPGLRGAAGLGREGHKFAYQIWGIDGERGHLDMTHPPDTQGIIWEAET